MVALRLLPRHYQQTYNTKRLGIDHPLEFHARLNHLDRLLFPEPNLGNFLISLFVVNRWLRGFAYRTPVGAGPFVAAGILAAGIAVVSVIFQTLKAATANPTKALRYE